MKPVFFKRGASVPVWHRLVGGDCTAETFNAIFKMQVMVLEVEGLRLTGITFKDPVRTAQ
jgi:hypothetical protein